MVANILSPTHLLLVLGVALLILGPKRLPEAGRGLGSAIRDFKDSLSGTELSDERAAPESLSEPAQTDAALSQDPSAPQPSRPVDERGVSSAPQANSPDHGMYGDNQSVTSALPVALNRERDD